MNAFLFIFTNNIIPLATLIILGYFMGKKFNPDISTLTKLNFYIFTPAFSFVSLYVAKIPLEMTKVLTVAICLLFANMGASWITSKASGYNEGFSSAFINSVSFYNIGNMGVPLVTLVFSSAPFIINGETPYLNIALTAQVMILAVQNITTNTLGFIIAGKGNFHWKESVKKVFKMPTIYAIPLAFILKVVPYDITTLPVWPALNYAKDALIPTALLALGIQLTKTTFDLKNKHVYHSVFLRLLVSPLLVVIFIKLFGITGIIAQVILISAATPTAVNCALIAIEYDNHPNFSSQTVMVSTILSTVTLVLIIFMARIIFPLAV